MEQAFGFWLSGMIDGEGTFTIVRRGRSRSCTPGFALGLREDDAEILEQIVHRTRIGRIYRAVKKNPQGRKPLLVWRVTNKKDCVKLVEILSAFPLRAKKKNDFVTWKRAVVLWSKNRYCTEQRSLLLLMAKLNEGRKWKETKLCGG